MSQTFETLATDCNQPVAQSVSHHNERQPMSSQQKAAMAQAALINFFGESGTVTSIMNTVQPSHTQTLTEMSNQPELNISEHQQGKSLPVSTYSYTIPHIPHLRPATTDTITQQNSNKVTEYHIITLILILILIEEEWEDKIHIIITFQEG